MAEIIITCGKICVGKSTYARKLCRDISAALLSVDEIMLSVFGQNAGEKHDEYVEKIKKYLLEKSCELAEYGISSVLDFGLWSKDERKFVRQFYTKRGFDVKIHYLDISDEEWKKRIEKRNRLITEGKSDAYFIDEGLLQKLLSVFEKPERNEVDVWCEGK